MKLLTIILTLLSLICTAQKSTWRVYSEVNGFCSFSLQLFNDSSYSYERGCEGDSQVNIGSWLFVNDTILLMPIDTSNFECINSVSKTKDKTSDTCLTITIVDKYDKPVEDFQIAYIPKNFDQTLLTKKSMSFVNARKKIITESICADHKGKILIKNRQKGLIKLLDIKQIFGKDILINFDLQKENNLIIKLNLQRNLFGYPSVEWVKMDSLKIENDPIVIKFKNK